jgi:cell division protein FtsX
MNWKRFFAASLVIYVVVQALDFVFNELFMKAANESLKGLWRPNMMSRMWLLYVVSALSVLLFTYIFVKGREGKGVAEGVRYGIIIWLFVTVPMNVAWWVMLPIPYIIVLRWLLIGLLGMLIAGILAAVIYKPREAPKA